MTFEEVKEMFKKSIDATDTMNQALENLIQSIYLKGYGDAISEIEKLRAEIQENINYNKKMNYQGIVAGLLLTLDIIDKYKAIPTGAEKED